MPSTGKAELADVGRLARRLLNRAVETARTEDQPLRRLLRDHLGPDAAYLPTASATWPSYEHVNVQVGVDAWLAGRSHEVYGITGMGFMYQLEIVGIGDLPVPDAEARRRLIRLYQGNLVLDLAREDSLIERTEGVTAAFLKELLRKVALLSCEDEAGSGPIRVTDTHLEAALGQLLDGRNQLTRVLLGGGKPEDASRDRVAAAG